MLSDLMKRVGVTQKELADKLRVSQSLVHKWCSGICPLTDRWVVTIANAIGVEKERVLEAVGPGEEEMTQEERAAIFAKEVLTIRDFQRLFHVSYQSAAKLMREIKFKSDRLGVVGIVHIQDYCDALNLNRADYIYRKKDGEEEGESND